jgi:DNA topoisomerase-1
MDNLLFSERLIVEAGYRSAYKPVADNGPAVVTTETSSLSSMKKGQRVRARVRNRALATERGMTEAELLRALQAKGIGRPSTYSGIIAELINRKYVIANGRLKSSERGQKVWSFLSLKYPHLFTPDFTAKLEAQLDALAEGKVEYKTVLKELWEKLPK